MPLMMNKIYDINSDHLKCNFCTNWFKCTLHFANIQRYSIKACPKCFQNFHYSLLHPETNRLYKIILFDTGLTIPSQEEDHPNYEIYNEIMQVQDQVLAKISQEYYKKIQQLMALREKQQQQLNQHFNQLQKMSKRAILLPFEKDHITKRLKEIVQRDNFEPNVLKSHSYANSRRKKSYDSSKQNKCINRNGFGLGKSIRGKVTGLDESRLDLSINKMKQSYLRPQSRPKSLWDSKKSINLENSKCSINENQRAEVEETLGQKLQGLTYIKGQIQNDHILLTQSSRILADSIIDMKKRTTKDGQLIQLIGGSSNKIPFQSFLRSLGEQPLAKTVRIIRIGLTDLDFDSLLRFLALHPLIQTVIVTNNRLTEASVEALHDFCLHHKDRHLVNVYMGNNRIKRDKVQHLKNAFNEFGINLYH